MQRYINPESQSRFPTTQPPKIKHLIFPTTKTSHVGYRDLYKYLKRSTKNERSFQPNASKYYWMLSNLASSKKFIKILRTQHSLLELDYPIPSIERVFPIRYFFSKIRSLASSAPRRWSFGSNMIDPRFKTALKTLSYLKNLTHLSFEFPSGVKGSPDPEALKTFFRSLIRLKNIRHLSIDMNHSKDTKTISSFLAHFSQLQSLKLRTGGSNLPEFTPLLSKLPNLTKLGLHLFGNTTLSSEDVLAFYMGFKHIKSLTDLTLDFGNCLLAQTDLEPLSEGLAMLSPLLQKLGLKLCTGIRDDGLLQIFQDIKRFKKLQTLDLTLPYLMSKKRITSSLASTLSELGSLSSLKIYFDISDERKFAIVDITTALESLQKLSSLKLSFAGEENTKDGPIQKFSSKLKQLKDLHYLDLQFYFKSSMSDLALESLSEGFKELINLKNLRLSFSNDQKFTNKGVRAFCCAVKELKNLTGLAFQLENNSIDEKAIVEITKMLRDMPQLSEVSFSFYKCAKIKKKGDSLGILFKTLKELKNIGKITLTLHHSNFNEKAVQDLKKIKNVLDDLKLY